MKVLFKTMLFATLLFSVTACSKDDPYYGHEYVDLGLPSGVKWATCNIGATSPEDYGDYYAWGETSKKETFSWETYQWCNGSRKSMTKYCTDSEYGEVDNKTNLDLTDDVAHVTWGGKWRMPTPEDIDELLNEDYTTIVWTTQGNKNGIKVTSKTNGNSIFLPAAGGLLEDEPDEAGFYGSYWQSSLNSGHVDYTYALYFDCDYWGWDGGTYRCVGQPVRAVCPQ